MQIRQLDYIAIHESQGMGSCASEVRSGRAAEASCTNNKDLRGMQAELSRETDRGDDHLAAITGIFFLGKGPLCWWWGRGGIGFDGSELGFKILQLFFGGGYLGFQSHGPLFNVVHLRGNF
jgi:hypothetical protein